MPKSAADAKTVLTPTEAILESISDGVFTAAVPDIPLRPVFRGYEESAFVNFLEQSHDGTGGWPLCGRQPAAG